MKKLLLLNLFLVVSLFGDPPPTQYPPVTYDSATGIIKKPVSLIMPSLTLNGLTPGRIPFVSTGGLLIDNTALTFNSSTGALGSTSFVGALTGSVNGNTFTTGTGTLNIGTGGTLGTAAYTASTDYLTPEIPGQQIYVMSAFKDNPAGGSKEERLRLLLSKDLITWTPIGGTADTASVRDPCLFYFNGTYYYTYTVGAVFGSVNYYGIRKSDDLVTWTAAATISTASIGSISYSWAGTVYQESGNVYSLVSVSTDSGSTMKPYIVQATASDLSTWGTPTEITGTGFPARIIAQQIVKIGSTYYLWAKDDVSDYEVIYSSSSLASGYTAYHTGDWASWGTTLEGGMLVNTSGNNWTAVGLDVYPSGGLYYATSTDNLATFSSKKSLVTQGKALSNPAVLTLTTAKQYRQVLALLTSNLGQNLQSLGTPPTGTVSPYDYMLWLDGKAAISNREYIGGSQGLQFFANTSISNLTLTTIDTTKPTWWLEMAVGSDDCFALYHGTASNAPNTLFFNVSNTGAGKFATTVSSYNGVDAANSVYLGSNVIVGEGSTADAFEGTFAFPNVTADRTWTPPDASGTIALTTGSFTHYTDITSTSTDGTENDLYSDSITAGTFTSDGQSVTEVEHVQFVTSATASRRLRKYFGGTLIFDTGTLTPGLGGVDVTLTTTIIRESSSVARCDVSALGTTIAVLPPSTYTRVTGLTMSGALTLKTTGTASGTGAASGDILNKIAVIKSP